MVTKAKIQIQDVLDKRNVLDAIYEQTPQITLARWSLELAKHILTISGVDYTNNSVIQDGFATNEAWQNGTARMYDVRQAGFKVHQLAKACDNQIKKTALRVAGQAIGTGHMREHAMVASDYAIKAINLLYPNDEAAILKERQWQIDNLNRYET
jgi:hypothetical protein